MQNLNYSTKKINKSYLMKVSGNTENGYVNKLVGVKGLLDLIGVERANKFIERAERCLGDKCVCKVYGGLQVSFYIH